MVYTVNAQQKAVIMKTKTIRQIFGMLACIAFLAVSVASVRGQVYFLSNDGVDTPLYVPTPLASFSPNGGSIDVQTADVNVSDVNTLTTGLPAVDFAAPKNVSTPLFQPVTPEPSTFMLVSLGTGLLLFVRSRRQARRN
jgi:hypothetical protein